MAQLVAEGTDASDLPQSVKDSVQGLEDLSLKSSRGERSQNGWNEVAAQAKVIADQLRTEEMRTTLGATSLLPSCGTLLRLSVLAGTDALAAQTQLLRAVGNMCFDNDVNREHTRSAAIPAIILELLRRILRLDSSGEHDDAPVETEWRLDQLLFLRAATGALLNMSLDFTPIRDELNTSDSLAVLLSVLDNHGYYTRKTPSIYSINAWAEIDDEDREARTDAVDAGAPILRWTMAVLTNVIGESRVHFPPRGATILADLILSLPTNPSGHSVTLSIDPEDASENVEDDLSLLSEAAGLLEAVALDSEAVKEELGTAVLKDDKRLLGRLMDFVESSELPPHWIALSENKDAALKSFSLVKSAVVRAIVEVPNSDKMMNQLFAFGHKSWLIVRLVNWLEKAVAGRGDLLICAAHMLAALARKDEHCISLVQQYGVAAPLSKIVSAKCAQQFGKSEDGARQGETTQVLYGVVSLLRHLSIPPINKLVLGDTQIVGPVSGLLKTELDVVGPLQNTAVGLLKHLAAANVPNSLRILEPDAKLNSERVATQEPESPESNTAPIELVLSIISRTDDVRLRSEASRLLVNVVRSLFSTKSLGTTELAAASPITPTVHNSSQAGLDAEEVMKRRGRPKVARKEVAAALSEMVLLSERYPMLINEAVVGLTLLAGSGGAAIFVLDILIERHTSSSASSSNTPDASTMDNDTPLSPTSRTASLALSPAGDPSTAADMLATWLGLCASGKLVSQGTSGVRPEMIGNVCALLITVLRGADVAKADKVKVDELRSKVLAPLQGCVAAMVNESNETLRQTISRCLEVATTP